MVAGPRKEEECKGLKIWHDTQDPLADFAVE